jgi:putative transposase
LLQCPDSSALGSQSRLEYKFIRDLVAELYWFTRFMRTLLYKVPKKAQLAVGVFVRYIFSLTDVEEVNSQFNCIVERLSGQFPQASDLLADVGPDLLAFLVFPQGHWRQIWSNNPQERLNRQIRRRTDVVCIFPNLDAIIRPVGAVLAEQNDEWSIARRYVTLETINKAIKGLPPQEKPALPEAA